MQVHFINVGYGEAILVTGDDSTILIDGGTNRTEEYEHPGCIRTADYLKKIGISKIDLVIITHIHDDHIGGIPEVIRNFPVSQVWINVRPDMPNMELIHQFDSVIKGNLSGMLFRNALESYAELLEECGRRGIPVLQKGKEDGFLSFAEGFDIELLTPGKQMQMETRDAYDRLFAEKEIGKAEALFYVIDKLGNSTSISLRIKAGKTAVLLSGDKVDGWEEIFQEYGSGLESQILKVTHHGQMDGLPQAMIEVAQPEIFVICSSADKRFNSAHPAVIDRARVFLQEKRKNGGVYITGCLGAEMAVEKEICAVCFLCDATTGKIEAHFHEC